ncbi:MAG: hypothetical protein CMH57_04445 [Myxococcales bacterium]|nr:hypothetical protein [Myxococcales bacterium]
MTHIFIGCNRIVGRRQAYFNKLSALEVNATFDDEVSGKRLGQWRTESRKGFAFTMKASCGVTHAVTSSEQLPESLQSFPLGDFGLLRDTPAVRAAWQETLDLAEQLSPKAILLQTPLEFSPGSASVARIRWFAEELAPMAGKVRVAWQPHGLWEVPGFVELCHEIGLIPVYDPFIDEPIPAGKGTAYFVLYQRRGLRSRFDDFDMEELLELCEPYQRVIIIFRGTDCYRDARLAFTVWQAQQDEEP